MVGLALGHRSEHVALARAEPIQRSVALAAAQHPADHLGVKRAAAPRNPIDRVDEALDVTDALLEQVADSLGAVPDQLDRVVLLVVLRKHKHTGFGPLPSKLDRRPQAVVAVAWRHVDIRDRDRWPVREALAQEILGVASLSDDFESGIGEQSCDPLAQQHVVLADHHAKGV